MIRGISAGILMLFAYYTSSGQRNNPGFLGNRVALGYAMQVSLINLVFVPNDLIRHNFTLEFANSQYQSFTASLAYNKANLPSQDPGDEYLTENYMADGEVYQVLWSKNGGSSVFSSLSFGLRWNFYHPDKTIAAPEGFCKYLRVDLIKNKAMNNNYKYDILNSDQLSVEQKQNAKIPALKDTEVTALSIGYGIESKKMLSRSIYISYHAEININTTLLFKDMIFVSIPDEGINDNMRNIARRVDMFKNIVLVGFGTGVLL